VYSHQALEEAPVIVDTKMEEFVCDYKILEFLRAPDQIGSQRDSAKG
jgi:hypothetical protein